MLKSPPLTPTLSQREPTKCGESSPRPLGEGQGEGGQRGTISTIFGILRQFLPAGPSMTGTEAGRYRIEVWGVVTRPTTMVGQARCLSHQREKKCLRTME